MSFKNNKKYSPINVIIKCLINAFIETQLHIVLINNREQTDVFGRKF